MKAERRLAVLVGTLVLVALCGCGSGTPDGTGPTGTMTAMTTRVSPSSPTGPSLVVSLEYVPVCGPSDPSSPDCAPRPLGDVEVTVREDGGSVAAQGTTDVQGTASFTLAEGEYEVRGAAVPSATTPRPATVTVAGTSPVAVTIRYESNLQ